MRNLPTRRLYSCRFCPLFLRKYSPTEKETQPRSTGEQTNWTKRSHTLRWSPPLHTHLSTSTPASLINKSAENAKKTDIMKISHCEHTSPYPLLANWVPLKRMVNKYCSLAYRPGHHSVWASSCVLLVLRSRLCDKCRPYTLTLLYVYMWHFRETLKSAMRIQTFELLHLV